MVLENFSFFSPPALVFGPGCINRLPGLVSDRGKRLLLVLGGASFRQSRFWPDTVKGFRQKGIKVYHAKILGEPSPEIIDQIVDSHRGNNIDLVAAIGGGSVIDGGKAVSAMLTKTDSVTSFLEGVGHKLHDGKKLPFIAVPTTSGTGSEATKNAVVSKPGKNGFKKSLRHDNFVPDLALVDPELTLTCPSPVTAACGMDALTQLLESCVSTQGSAYTSALALNGLEDFGRFLSRSVLEDPDDIKARSRLSYGAYLSGLTLANAGLGTVHGLASSIGGNFKIPHGAVCGTLVAGTTRATIKALTARSPCHPGLAAYARAAVALGISTGGTGIENACQELVSALTNWTDQLELPKLGIFGMGLEDIDTIIRNTGQKNNPVHLSELELKKILAARI